MRLFIRSLGIFTDTAPEVAWAKVCDNQNQHEAAMLEEIGNLVKKYQRIGLQKKRIAKIMAGYAEVTERATKR